MDLNELLVEINQNEKKVGNAKGDLLSDGHWFKIDVSYLKITEKIIIYNR